MNEKSRPLALLGWMEGLADQTRLRALHLLERQELGVVELCDVLQLPQSTVSRHLKVLSDQGWLASQRHGTQNLYRMEDELHPAARRLWRLARSESAEWATLQQDQLRLESRLRERRGEAEAFFAGAAGEWDRLRTELYGTAFGEAALLSLLPPEWTVADLGCGTGTLTAELAPYLRRVIGVDRSAAMLRAARRRTEGLGNVELRRAGLEAVPLDDASCDAALLVLVLSYAVEPKAILGEAARIIRTGGCAVVVDLVRHDDEAFRRRTGQSGSGFEPERLVRLLAEVGLTATCRPLAPQPGTRGPALLIARARKDH
jgi:SAM-dependent methyltransferase